MDCLSSISLMLMKHFSMSFGIGQLGVLISPSTLLGILEIYGAGLEYFNN